MANGTQSLPQRPIFRPARLASFRRAVRPSLSCRRRCPSRHALKRREGAIDLFAPPLPDPGTPPVISKRNEHSRGYHFVNLAPDRRGFHSGSEIIVDHNPTMIHQQIAVVIEVPPGIAVRVEHEKTHFAPAKDL